VESGRERATLPCANEVACLALDQGRPLAACGDRAGNVYIAEFVGVEYGPLVATAVDLGTGAAVRCPACLEYLPLEDGALGQVVACPRPRCNGRIRVNSFVVGTPQPERRSAL